MGKKLDATWKLTGLILTWWMALGTVALLSSCGESPTRPSWCSPHASQLAGHWQRVFEHQDHQYEVILSVQDEGDCTFSFTYETHQTAPHDPSKVYESRGTLIVVHADKRDELIGLEFVSRRHYMYGLDEGDQPVINTEIKIFEGSTARIWGDQLVMWQHQYNRVGGADE